MTQSHVTLPVPPADSAGRIVFLDYLRIFAFSSVLMGHTYYGYADAFVQDTSHTYLLRFLLGLLLPLIYGGGAGVVVFFLVSGYIIAHVLQTERTPAFVVKRLFRIYPLYMFAVILSQIIDFTSRENVNLHLLTQVVTQHPMEVALYLQGVFIQLFFQLLLLGDFFPVPGTLGGVDWSLRLEIIFYAYMAALHALQLFQSRRKWLPWILGFTLFLLYLAPPFPRYTYTMGALNIYAPFFVLGTFFYLSTIKQIPRYSLLLAASFVAYQYVATMAQYQPRWIGTSFAMLALFIFTITWMVRNYLSRTQLIIFLSELTYATYLFHAWLYGYIERVLIAHSPLSRFIDIQALLLLLMFCALTVRLIEKPAVRFGNRLIQQRSAKSGSTLSK